MVRGLADGDIDIIVSSHDPQDADDKRRPFAEAADGAVGLETLLPAALRLHHSGELPLLEHAAGADHQPGQAARAALRAARQGRHRRHHRCSIRASRGSSTRTCCARAPRTRPSTRARCRGACCALWLRAKRSTSTLASSGPELRLGDRARQWTSFFNPLHAGRRCRRLPAGLDPLRLPADARRRPRRRAQRSAPATSARPTCCAPATRGSPR